MLAHQKQDQIMR